MAQLDMRALTASYLVSEAASPYRSREEGTVVGDATEVLGPGTILGRLANGNYVVHEIGGSGGAEVVAGILFEEVQPDTTVRRTITVRDCEVNGAHLIYPDGASSAERDTIDAALLALNIVVR